MMNRFIRQRMLSVFLSTAFLLSLAVNLFFLRQFVVVVPNEDAELALVYLPGENEENTIRKAIPKFIRNLKPKSFRELVGECEYDGRILNCPEVHLQGETLVRQSQLVIVRMLKIVDDIMKRHNVPYFIMFGTLLGAYRDGMSLCHDHDIDIGIMLEDYERLAAVIRKELPAEFFFQDGSDEPEYERRKAMKAKFRARNTCYANCFDCEFHDGLQIDIFVFKKLSEENVIDTEKGIYSYPRNDLLPTKDIDFEGMKFPAPANIPKILELSFDKNYMIPDTSFPREPHIPSPWYSCEYIKTSPRRDAIMKELMIR